MRKIIFTTESGADLPKELAEKHNIKTVPMHVVMDGTDYKDDGSLPVSKIYDYYNRTKLIPSTTSTNPNEYEEFFAQIKAENPDCTIVHIGYTSKASSSFHNAEIAAENFEDIYLIDALNVSAGLTVVTLYAAQLLESNPDIPMDELIQKIQASVPKSRMSFVPGSLEFLKAGGRVSNAAYISASLLQIKPLIELIDGKLVSTKKYRGKMSRVAEELLKDYLKKYPIDKKQIYFVFSIGLDEQVKVQMEQSAKEKGFENVTWIQAGSVISTHGGPGAFGIAGMEQ
ncbi:MAG: DegV family protein [Desemzia incerta]|uniref:EDD domain protein, DegV family n=1 Tax=Desemzia incerta TaxID=82801 RepID=A0A1I5YLN4_9LACT|nr:DegV family protein [Desemzia incerta]SFQ45106.1 EDD domain protein, DegV family [Desemzia incerta]